MYLKTLAQGLLDHKNGGGIAQEEPNDDQIEDRGPANQQELAIDQVDWLHLLLA